MYSVLFLTLIYLDFTYSDCYYPNLSKPYGYIQTPSLKHIFSQDYCLWVIDLGYYNILEIRIEYAHLADGDYIYIHDGATINSPILVKLFGTSRFRKITTSTGSAFIHYQKQPIRRLSTFNITYQIKGICIPGIQELCSEREVNCYDLRYERCNSIWNCPLSGKDEENCPACRAKQRNSKSMLFPCSGLLNSNCYSREQRCNGVPNCETIADEIYCDPVQCGAHNKTFLCQTFPNRCISESLRCNGDITCRDGSDELNCNMISPYSSHVRIILVSSISVILCFLMVVIGFVCVFRLHKMHLLTTRNLARRRGLLSQHDPSIQHLIDEHRRRGPLPPNYNYALCHSRPFRSVADVQKMMRSHSKLAGSMKKRVNNSCHNNSNSNDGSYMALPNADISTNLTNDSSDVQLLVPDIPSLNDNNQSSDVELIDPGLEDDSQRSF